MIAHIKGFVDGEVKMSTIDKGEFYPCHSPLIVQIERLLDDSYLFYCSFARDGSGLFLVSFISLLLTEDIHASTDLRPLSAPSLVAPSLIDGLSCVAGSVSVTYFSRLSKEGMHVTDIANHLEHFTTALKSIPERHGFPDASTNERIRTVNLTECRLTHLIHHLEDESF